MDSITLQMYIYLDAWLPIFSIKFAVLKADWSIVIISYRCSRRKSISRTVLLTIYIPAKIWKKYLKIWILEYIRKITSTDWCSTGGVPFDFYFGKLNRKFQLTDWCSTEVTVPPDGGKVVGVGFRGGGLSVGANPRKWEIYRFLVAVGPHSEDL